MLYTGINNKNVFYVRSQGITIAHLAQFLQSRNRHIRMDYQRNHLTV